MSDGQFAALMSFLVGFGGALLGMARWSVARVTAVIVDNSLSHREAAQASREQAVAFAELSSKVQFAFDASQKVNDRLVEENSGVHQASDPDADTPSRPMQRQSPPRGYPVGVGIHGLKRAGTRGDSE